MYVSEMAPVHKRGTYGVLFQLSLCFGLLVSYFVGWGIVVSDMSQFFKWRVMVAIGVVFPLLLLAVTIFKMVESSVDNFDEQIDRKPALLDLIRQSDLRWLLLTNSVLAAILQLTGINAVMYYGPQILKTLGNEYALTIGVGAWNFLSTFIAIFLVERLGRKPLMLGGVLVMSLSLIVIGLVFQYVTEPTPKAVGIGLSLAFFIAGFEGGPGCLFWVIVNELFPEEYKETAASFANILQWAFNLLVSLLFPIISQPDKIGKPGTFYLFGAVGAVCFLYSLFFLPETKQVENWDEN
eukprot:TRINITY_DN1715_c0_g1_i10.p1 TRINITY_DN1715_c0_g1~~TRINITY_DN1715_c0_g1_i10.p1  ORF type:complete len:295 (+),score=39.46 TRINITY_DN1715_c0_g1_i10:497-1381(+)